MYVHSTIVINWQAQWSPRALTGVSARKLEKLALNSGIAGGARKMTQNASKRPHHRHHNASYQSLLHNGNVHDSAGELNLTAPPHRRDETCRCMITGTFTTAEDLRHLNLHTRDIGHLEERCNCGTFAVFCTFKYGHCR